MKISGEFDVKLSPIASENEGTEGVNLGRMRIDKTFHGELDGISMGEMLTAMTPVKGSAGYVAIEQVSGTLGGKKGSFVLQHFGVMSAAGERLVLEVVPDSGTGELQGLSGEMAILRDGGQHRYEFEYELG